ncbi:MAG: hypothetical protein ABW352_13875 [Polyangiales bacterium]
MRGTSLLLLALIACGDDDNDKPVTDASTPRLDGSPNKLDATLITKCGPVMACQSGALTQLPELCLGSVNAQPTGGLWKICVIDPQGRTSYIQIHEDERITSAGWTHSNYGLVDATLSDEGYDACITERGKLIPATEDNTLDAGNTLCLRASNSGDD